MLMMEFVGDQYRKMDEWARAEESTPKQITKISLVNFLDGVTVGILINGIIVTALGVAVNVKNLVKK